MAPPLSVTEVPGGHTDTLVFPGAWPPHPVWSSLAVRPQTSGWWGRGPGPACPAASRLWWPHRVRVMLARSFQGRTANQSRYGGAGRRLRKGMRCLEGSGVACCLQAEPSGYPTQVRTPRCSVTPDGPASRTPPSRPARSRHEPEPESPGAPDRVLAGARRGREGLRAVWMNAHPPTRVP